MSIRSDFKILNQDPFHYFDTAASSLTPQVVIDAMSDHYENRSVNVHRGSYKRSYEATLAYENARRKVAQFVGAEPEEVVFTSGASHALNMIAYMIGETLEAGDEVITSELEHHSQFLPWQRVVKEKNLTLKFVELTEDGRITLEAVLKQVTKKTKVIALNYVSNTYAHKAPIEAIKKAVGKDVYVVVDAAQAAAHTPVDFKTLDVDFLAFSGHKMFGPHGVGVMVGKISHLEAMGPYFLGGEMNDLVTKETVTFKDPPDKFETGTPPIAEAIGLHKAIEYIESIGLEKLHQLTSTVKTYALEQMKALEGITIYNQTSLGPIILFNIDGVHPHDAASGFDEYNVALRAGHHCAQLMMHWLNVNATLRASFHAYNTKEDVDVLIQAIKSVRDFFQGAFA
jgi:cysteine desulfurase/selenocysteine lyase